MNDSRTTGDDNIAGALKHFRSRNQPLWIYGGKEYSVSDLNRFVKQHSRLFAILDQHPRVALYLDNPVHLGMMLISLSGRVDQVILIVRSAPGEQLIEFIQRSHTDLLITDDDIARAGPVNDIHLYDVNRVDDTADTYEAPLESSDTTIIIPTSGTTDEPKLVCHTLSSLTRTTRTNLDKGGEYRWGLLYDILRFAGLQVFLQSLLGGSTLVVARADDPMELQLDQLIRSQCNAISATPTLWRSAILRALRARYPRARITHIYASTEAGVGFAVNDLQPGFPASFLKDPPNNVAIRVDGDGFLHLRQQESNEPYYLGTGESLADEQGFINTGDLVRREGDRYLFIGRANGTINVGGNKVQPEEVEQVLLLHPGAEFARVGAVRSSLMGELVTATIKTKEQVEDPDSFRAELLAFCSERLEPYKVPTSLEYTDEVELNSSGKLKRKRT